jgi:hypothetical protein
MSAQSNHPRADWEADENHRPRLNIGSWGRRWRYQFNKVMHIVLINYNIKSSTFNTVTPEKLSASCNHRQRNSQMIVTLTESRSEKLKGFSSFSNLMMYNGMHYLLSLMLEWYLISRLTIDIFQPAPHSLPLSAVPKLPNRKRKLWLSIFWNFLYPTYTNKTDIDR